MSTMIILLRTLWQMETAEKQFYQEDHRQNIGIYRRIWHLSFSDIIHLVKFFAKSSMNAIKEKVIIITTYRMKWAVKYSIGDDGLYL